MNRKEILKDANNKISQERAAEYGDAFQTHVRVAKMWSAILGHEVTVPQVYQCMIAVKLGRLSFSPEHIDSWVDIAGYAALGGEAPQE
tara:strand:- start:3186 stop:3449 length:264 start_codon:yes stop_codon:yes gene_type:complete